jgi:hypothetical protein
MVAYTFYIYSVDVLSYNPDQAEFALDAGYDYTTDRYRIEVSDDDAVMDASLQSWTVAYFWTGLR